MRSVIPAVLLLVVMLTIGLAGDWLVDNVSISNRISQTTASAANSVMGALGIGTAAPEAKLHVAGDVRIEGELNVSSNRVTHLAAPIAASDGVTKAWVEEALQNVEPAGGVSMGSYTNR
ncbi:MAG: hypothetical protein HQ523_01705 [Lentisphaerae bacterium]|nr:hypothetical protein [Lentisphaerota bacterium]